jgi:hypothetical protein
MAASAHSMVAATTAGFAPAQPVPQPSDTRK